MMIIRVFERGAYRLEEWQFGDATTGHYVLKKRGLFSKPQSIMYLESEADAMAIVDKYRLEMR